jgi:hypothetical protein
MHGNATTTIKNNLAQNSIRTTVDNIRFETDKEENLIEEITFNFNIKNIDIAALQKLEKLNIENEEETNKLIQALIIKGISMEIPSCVIKKIKTKGKRIDGFSLTTHIDIDKSFDITTLQTNPMAAINAVNTKTKITLSSELFSLIAQQPRAMMIMMLIQPQEVNGKKVYEVELKNGSFTVNGKSIF